MKVKSEREVAQSCATLNDPMDCSLPASSVHGIFQARALEWGAIEGINSRMTEAGERINDLEDTMVEISTAERNIEKRMERNEDRLRDLWDNIKHIDIHIIGVPEREERKKGPEQIYEEKTPENFPNMGKEIVNQVQEAQRVLVGINPRRNTPRHTVIKLTKIKDRDKTLKEQGENDN